MENRRLGTASPADPDIAAAVSRLSCGRLTRHQELALQLGGVALDMPMEPFGLDPLTRGSTFRQANRFPPGRSLMWWVLDVARENLLAAAVLFDALDMFVGLLGTALPYHVDFPDAQSKREWTQGVGSYDVEFVVPDGWDFVFDGTSYPAGFRGVAGVDRCHLSQRTDHNVYGEGRLKVLGGPRDEAALGFDIPCFYFSGVRVVEDKVVVDKATYSPGRGAILPYEFVGRAYRRPIPLEHPIDFIPRPTDEQVVEMARAAMARMQDRSGPRDPETSR